VITYKKALRAALVAAATALAASPASALDYSTTLGIMRNESIRLEARIDKLAKELKLLRRREIRLTTECSEKGCTLKEAVSFGSHEACERSIDPGKRDLSVCAPLTSAVQDDVPTGQ
jgi:hypothetical protein